MVEFGEQVRRAWEAKGMTQQTLAAFLEVSLDELLSHEEKFIKKKKRIIFRKRL